MEKPPFQITATILALTSRIQEIIGELKSETMTKPSLKLRRENKIKSVHHSLAIEGNSLTEEQVTAILENKRVLGPKAQIIEVKNALELYDSLSKLDPLSEKHFLKAHKLLMRDLLKSAGKYRTTSVGVFKGTKVSHVAPPSKFVPTLMDSLFNFVKQSKEIPWLIKACAFHYELEFIHPFEDGNGRMGRLWQQVLLIKQSPLFEYVSTETLVRKRQAEYYRILEKCDKAGDSTAFIEFSLENILESLIDFKSKGSSAKPKIADRIAAALEHFADRKFSRKEYMLLHRGLSTATASRDLADAVSQKLLLKFGNKAQTIYKRKT